VIVRFFDADATGDGVMSDPRDEPAIPADTRFVVAVPGCDGRKLYGGAVALDDPVAPAVRTSRTRLRSHRNCR